VAQRGLYGLGVLRGENQEGTDEELKLLVLNVPKAILEALPCLQFEHDGIEEADSLYGHILNVLDNAEGEEVDPGDLPMG